MVEQVLRTLMRTTDIIVTAMMSPLAVAAIGLADLYARLPLRLGLGLGSASIALSSQDTGGDAIANRDEAVTQALLLGFLTGIPFVAFGFLFGEQAIAVIGFLGDDEEIAEVARLGGLYLAIIFATAPARHVALVGARALQGTGDTRTPMYVNIVSNTLNILLSLLLGLGLFGAPRLEIVGVGIGTAVGNVFTAVLLTLAIATDWTDASFTRPQNPVITKQLVVLAVPPVAEGLVATIIEFPFNALLLMFGAEVNAAYQVGLRVYQQVTGPLSRGINVGASIVVGQAIGDGDAEAARFNGWATAAFGVLTVGSIGLVLVTQAEWIARLLTDDPATLEHAADFTRVYGLAAPLSVLYTVLSGALKGASDTTTPFVARASGLLLFFLGFSWVASVGFGLGLLGIYLGIVLYYGWALLIVGRGFYRGHWADRATRMMADRGSTDGARTD